MKSLNQILETDASVNSVAAMATPDVPLFSTRRFGGWDDHVVPEDHYMTIRNGRERLAKWKTHLPNPDIKAAVQKSLYRDGCCLITNAKTGLSVVLKHAIQRRAQKAQDIDATMMAYESTEQEDESIEDFTVFDESQVMPLIVEAGELYEFDADEDEEYIQAYGYYFEDMGKTDDESDVFGQIVACFFDNLYTSDDEAATIDSLFNAAVTEVKAGSDSLGLNDVTIEIIHDAKKYIEENYDVVTGERIGDEEIEYDMGEDEDAVVFTEAAALAELPTVNPEDPSKSDEEGWAIINMKGNKVIDKPKKGETMEHKTAWLADYYGGAGAQEGHEVAWVNTKTGVVTKVADAKPAAKK